LSSVRFSLIAGGSFCATVFSCGAKKIFPVAENASNGENTREKRRFVNRRGDRVRPRKKEMTPSGQDAAVTVRRG